MADVLGSGPDRARPGRARRRLTAAGTVGLVAAAVLLAARAAPDRRDPGPAPAPVAATRPVGVVSVAVGTRWLYALAARCGPPPEVRCSYELFREGATETRWTRLALRTSPRPSVGADPAQLWVTGDDQVTVLDEPTFGPVYVSPDGGATANPYPLRPGPPVAAVPPDGILDLGLCDSCSSRLTVLEPGTELLRPLATQPPLRGATPRALDRSGAVIRVAEPGRTGVDTAVSTDSGRTWRAVPAAGPVPGSARLIVSARPDGGGHLLAVGADDAGVGSASLWAAAGPAAGWQRLGRPSGAGVPLSAVETGRGLLVGDAAGGLWRLRPDGGFDRATPATLDGTPTRLGRIVTGPAGVLLAVPVAEQADGRVLVSRDDGESWRAERIDG